MIDEDIVEICRYEVFEIVDDNYNTLLATNNLETATEFYNKRVEERMKVTDSHIIIQLYDYDKCAKLNCYDSFD